jgi:hypothetical protein
MSRRFSDEPINLIHRIPTPEQLLAAAGPSKRSWGQALAEAGAAWAQNLAAAVRHMTGSAGTVETAVSAQDAREAVDAAVPVRERSARVAGHRQPVSSVSAQVGKPFDAVVQPEEVAELRAYLLTQQQDIARLSAQLQDLKSMVVSQQQVLAYMGKEMEAAPTMTGVASAPAKRNRAVREKSYAAKEKAVPRQDVHNPSLSL